MATSHHGRIDVRVRPVAKMPSTVAPQVPDRAVALQRQTVQLASGNSRHAAEETYPSRAEHLHGRVAAKGDRSVARLSASVLPPGPDRAVALQRQTVQPSSGNSRDAAARAQREGIVVVGVFPDNKLPVTVQ